MANPLDGSMTVSSRKVPNRDGRPGYCWCGCGEKAPIAKQTHKPFGHVKGAPVRFIRFHHNRIHLPAYKVTDCGFDTPCWAWQGAENGVGYGMIHEKGSRTYAHRAFFEQRRGPIPVGMELDHLCHVSLCVNPDHLEPVSHRINIQRGKHAKLNHDAAQEIRHLSATQGLSQAQLGRQFGVGKTTIGNILRGKSWLR